jgi:hypothetical protein
MRGFDYYQVLTKAALAVAILTVSVGCEQLPGTHQQQGAAIGGLGGAAVGAAIGGEHHRLLGALLGGALGAGGGYLIGANSDRITGQDTAAAEQANRNAQARPATAQDALNATTADLNGDGFVTMDEVVAMKQAGLPDQAIVERLHATGQVFELTPEQQRFLADRGVSQNVIGQMLEVNRDVRDRLTGQQSDGGVISRPPGQ